MALSLAAATLGSAALGFLGARSTNKAASAQAARSMEFEERLSKTAHQRQVADMRAAGLNPILSATGGSGASTPSGKAAPVIDPVSTATQSVSSAMQAARMNQELKNLAATENFTKEQTKAIKYGVPGKTLGTEAIDAALGIANPNSAKSVPSSTNKKSNFNLKEYEKTTPSQEKAIQKLLNKQRKRK